MSRPHREDLVARAVAAHLRQPGALQPADGACCERRHAGRGYVVVANSNEVLSVYRVARDLSLKRLKRWPAELEA